MGVWGGVMLVIIVVEVLGIYLVSRVLVGVVYKIALGITRSKRGGVYVVAVVFSIGTFVHEMAHFLMALFLLAPVYEVELLPELDEKTDELKLGSVPVGKVDFLRMAIIGVAPFLAGVSLIGWIIGGGWWGDWGVWGRMAMWLVGGWVMVAVSCMMFSSKSDLVAVYELLGVAVGLVIIGSLVGLRVPSVAVPGWIWDGVGEGVGMIARNLGVVGLVDLGVLACVGSCMKLMRR